MKTEQKEQYYFFISFKDGTTETVQTSIGNGILMLQEIDIKKSKIKYAALIKEPEKIPLQKTTKKQKKM